MPRLWQPKRSRYSDLLQAVNMNGLCLEIANADPWLATYLLFMNASIAA